MLNEAMFDREELVRNLRPTSSDRLRLDAIVAAWGRSEPLELCQAGGAAQPRGLTQAQIQEREQARGILNREVHPRFITPTAVNRGSASWTAERLQSFNAAAYQFTRHVLNDPNSSEQDQRFAADVQDARQRIFEDRLASTTDPRRRLGARILATEASFLQTLASMRLGDEVQAGQAMERANRILMEPFLPPPRPQEQMSAQTLNVWARWLRDNDIVPEGFRGRAAVQATILENLARTRTGEMGATTGSLTASVADQLAGMNWNWRRGEMNEQQRRDNLIRSSAIDWQLQMLMDGARTHEARQRIVDTINQELRRRGSDAQIEECNQVAVLHAGDPPWQLTLRHGSLPERRSTEIMFPLVRRR